MYTPENIRSWFTPSLTTPGNLSLKPECRADFREYCLLLQAAIIRQERNVKEKESN